MCMRYVMNGYDPGDGYVRDRAACHLILCRKDNLVLMAATVVESHNEDPRKNRGKQFSESWWDESCTLQALDASSDR